MAKKEYACPDCDHVSPSLQGIGRHRSVKHGYIGPNNKKAKRERQGVITDLPDAAQVIHDELTCPYCGRVAKNKAGNSMHMNKCPQNPNRPMLVTYGEGGNGVLHSDVLLKTMFPDGIPAQKISLVLQWASLTDELIR